MNRAPDQIALYVADSEAKKFLLFQEYYEPFSILLKNEVFEQKNAFVTLFFDDSSTLQSIERRDYLFKRKFDTLSTL